MRQPVIITTMRMAIAPVQSIMTMKRVDATAAVDAATNILRIYLTNSILMDKMKSSFIFYGNDLK